MRNKKARFSGITNKDGKISLYTKDNTVWTDSHIWSENSKTTPENSTYSSAFDFKCLLQSSSQLYLVQMSSFIHQIT